MGTGAAVDVLGLVRLPTELVRRAELALIPVRRSAWTRLWHPLGQCDPLSECYQLPSGFRVKVHALEVIPIIVLADSGIQRTLQPGAQHVDLHLRPVLGLGFLNAIFRQRIKGFFVVRLDLQ